jgi:hypothetical protein
LLIFIASVLKLVKEAGAKYSCGKSNERDSG